MTTNNIALRGGCPAGCECTTCQARSRGRQAAYRAHLRMQLKKARERQQRGTNYGRVATEMRSEREAGTTRWRCQECPRIAAGPKCDCGALAPWVRAGQSE